MYVFYFRLDKIKDDNEFIRSDVLKFVSQCQVRVYSIFAIVYTYYMSTVMHARFCVVVGFFYNIRLVRLGYIRPVEPFASQ